jgi:hypothetical protein
MMLNPLDEKINTHFPGLVVRTEQQSGLIKLSTEPITEKTTIWIRR